MTEQAIVLDVGGVFLVPSHDELRDGLGTFADRVTDTAIERAHYHGVRAIDDAAPEPFDLRCYVTGFVDGLGVASSDRAGLVERLLPWWTATARDVWSRVLPGSVAALRTLAAHIERLAIVSNSDGRVTDRLLRHGICQIGPGDGVPVLCITDSAVKGVAKPDPRIFDDAIAAVGVAPAQAVYVGDSVSTDVRGAQAAGMRAVHLDPLGLCRQAHDHEHLRSLAGLSGLLRAGS